MHVAAVLAAGYRYPGPDGTRALRAGMEASTHGVVKGHLERFLTQVEALTLAGRDELHTATLDLSPLFVPYVGHVVWGENYRRGEFMAELNAAMAGAGVDRGGELPDHIEPILRYLAAVAEPLAELVEILPGAIRDMHQTLVAAAPDNPYRHLLAATVAYSADLRPVTIGRAKR